MNGLIHAGWVSPAGVLFPLASYNPDRKSPYDAHKADWEKVYKLAKDVQPAQVLTPALRADAANWARGMRLDPGSIEQAAA